MEDVVKVEMKRADVFVWVETINKTETRILAGITPESENDPKAMEVVKLVSGNEKLVLRHKGFEMPEGFKPETIERQIDGKIFRITTYIFTMLEWKRKTMKGWFEGKRAAV